MDISISIAVLAFNLAEDGSPIDLKVLKLFDRPEGEFTLTYGAVETRWKDHRGDHLPLLYELVGRLMMEFDFSKEQLQRSLSVIPEFRLAHGITRWRPTD
jgi:hypothetical protein